ncbi:putative transcription factor MYB family [Helianthus annuus]|nr:putative transcription factor MYB family [Helianthus annuus]
MQANKRSKWTKEQNKWFESALAIFDTETPDRWSNVAAFVPGKSEYEVREQYEALKADINNIEAGLVEDPGYLTVKSEYLQDHGFKSFANRLYRSRSFDPERRKGVPWTEDEHRRFLMGLQVHGKGDWRNISRNFVVTKTPTQVASHAQKYYARQHSEGKEKRRPSIHDITTVHLDKSLPLVNTPNDEMINIRAYNSGLYFQPTIRYQVQG